MITPRKLVTGFLARNKSLVLVTFIASIAGSLLTVLIPLSIGKFYEIVLHDRSVKGKLFDTMHISIETSKSFFIFFLTLIVLKSAITYAERFFTGMLGERFARNLRELLFRTQLSHSMTVHELRPAGKYLLRYSGDLIFIQRFISKGIIGFTGDIIFLLAAFAVLFTINAPLTWIVTGGIVISVIIIMLLNKYVRAATLKRRNQRSLLLGFVANRLQAFFTIKSFNREVPEESQFNSKSRKMYDLGINYYRIYSLVQALLPLLFFATLAVVLYSVEMQRQVKPYGIHRSDVLNFILLMLYIQSSVKRVLGVNVIWQMGHVSFMKLLRIINFPAETRGESDESPPVSGKITFENITFPYPTSEQPVIKDLSFCIEPNTITWIRGRQGSGKSTILKLILGMYPPAEGKILLDELNYATLPPNSIRKNVTVISDEAPLIGNTIFKAISYSRAEEKREKAADMLERTGFSINGNKNETLDFHLDDYAKNLSAGQRRQLMFARAFLTRKKVILVDEAFDDLDIEARQRIIHQLNKLKAKRTIIIASHQVPYEIKVDHLLNLNELSPKMQLLVP